MATVLLNPPSGSDGATATKRRYGVGSASLAALLADCDAIDIREYRDVAVKPPAAVTSLAVYASETASGTYVLVDNIGTAGAVTVTASKWNVLDTAKIAPFGFIKLLPTGGTGTASILGKT